MRKNVLLLLLGMTLALVMCACGTSQTEEPNTETKAIETETEGTDPEMKLLIDGQETAVEWENNEAVAALRKQVKEQALTIDMSMYGDFEQVGELGVDLPADDTQTETEAGDIMLYAGDKIVLFYGQNSWAYTRLGKIKDTTQEDMTELLGRHNVTVTLK